MSSDISAKLQRMGRRRFLRILAGLGVSGAAVTHLSRDAVAEVDLDEEVPRLGKLSHTNHEEVIQGEPPEREPIHYTISRDKWAVVETAHDAASQVTDRLESAGFEDGARAGVTTVTRNNHDQKAVIVTRTVGETADGQAITPGVSEDELKDTLPATISGTAGDGEYQQTIEDIPVEIETERVAHPFPTEQPTPDVTGPGDHYEHKYRPVPGGACIQGDTHQSYMHGTSCAVAYNEKTSNMDLVTAAHVLNYNDPEEIHQPKDVSGDDHQVGTPIDEQIKTTAENGVPGFDAGMVNLSTDAYNRFAADSGDDESWTAHHIYGTLGRDKIVDNENNEEFTVDKRGSTTGHDSGHIIQVYDDDSAFDIEADGDGGDSGGPFFCREYDSNYDIWKVYVAGVHYAGRNDRLSERATMMEAVETEFDLRV